jgi:hypothetical protein
MVNRDNLIKRIEVLPPHLIQEVIDYIDFILYKKNKKNVLSIADITLASEKALAKDWLKPEEDEAWEDL